MISATMVSKFKKYLVYTILLFNGVQAFALTCSDLETGEDPSLVGLACIFVRILNIGLLAVGGVLIVMLAYGGYKLAVSMGDPKGLSGAQTTWFYALVGAAIIVGVFAIIRIIGAIFGITILDPTRLFQEFETGLHYILQAACVEGGGPGCT